MILWFRNSFSHLGMHAVFTAPEGGFLVDLVFTNGLDPDNPLKFIENSSFKAYRNQTVPNFYIEIARLTGIFPWYVTIMLGHQVLKHRGFISSDNVVDSKSVVMGRYPSVTVEIRLMIESLYGGY